jgi:autotransporter-associated beta strand protein
MKVYSQPEVLEAHIAPAALITELSESGLQAESLLIGGPEFDIRIVTFASDGSLIYSRGAIDLHNVFSAPLSGDTGVESALDELNVSHSVTEGIESAVGITKSGIGTLLLSGNNSVSGAVTEGGSATLGLSSDEYARTSGNALLTSL